MYDLSAIRKDFPLLEDFIYLDNAATTQTPLPAVKAMEEYLYKYAANYGRGAHRLARMTTDRYENTRETVASFLNSDVTGTIFTRNATESINMVAYGLQWHHGDHMIVPIVEHHSNLLPWLRLRDQGVEITVVQVDEEGVVDPEHIELSITDRTRLVAVNHVTNVFGSIQDIRKMVQIAHENGCQVLIDASQSAGHMPLDMNKIGADFLVAPGHKGLLGPQGTGILCLRDPDSISPMYLGGGMVSSVSIGSYQIEASPARFEAGTPNIPGVIGLGRAVEYVRDIGVGNIEKHEATLAKKAASLLAEIPGVQVYGPKDRAGVVSFNVHGMNPHDVAIILDQTRKICVRSGYHCAMPAIKGVGLKGTVRASFALYNTIEEVEILAETVANIAELVDR
ncbi:cysteine desulfurase [Methanomethylovorans sp.]|uniref:cysteine desulfurase n=1 Tax=Methanomethylovorans sp. TaxID=2758717 RepID=UPI00345E581F